MIEDDAFREEVEASLRQASDGQLVRIMQFIERLPSRSRFDDVVAPVRGRLAIVRPVRSVTIARVLTLPIEEILVDPAHGALSPWVLPRDILPVFHDICLAPLDADEVGALEAEVTGATMDDRTAVEIVGRRLWPMAAATIRRFLDSGTNATLPVGFREPHGACLAGIATLLDNAGAVTLHLDRLPPRPMPALNGEQRDIVQALLKHAGSVSVALLRFAFTILIRRSGEPAGLFRLLRDADIGVPAEVRELVLSETASECLAEIGLLNDDAGLSFGDGGLAGIAEIASRLATLLTLLDELPRDVAVDHDSLELARRRTRATLLSGYRAALTGPMRRMFARLMESDGQIGDSMSDDEVAAAEAAARAVGKIESAGHLLGIGPEMETARDAEIDGFRIAIGYRAAGTGGDFFQRVGSVADALRLVEIVANPRVAAAIVDSIADAK